MATLIAALAPNEGLQPTAVPGVEVARTSESAERKPLVYEPMILFLGQGSKRAHLGDDVVAYGPDRYLALSVPIPVACEMFATPAEPLLALKLKVEPELLAELLINMDEPTHGNGTVPRGIYASPLGAELKDAVIRLLECLRSPLESRILGRQIVREIVFRVLRDEPGGALRALPQPRNREYGEYMLSPRVVRALVADRKYEAALAFQTRNPLHRAHEYALVWAGEYLTKQGLYTGIFLNPLMGELKGDDVPAAMRMRCYRKLHGDRLLGQGDQQPEIWEKAGYPLADVFELVGLDIKMFYGGPREAVMHGIYRQNYGFSHLIIGRKHADAPYEDGSAIWGDFDAQEIFQQLKGDLRIGTVNVGFAAFYESLGRVDLTENHPDEKPVSVSGTKVREQLKGGERPDPRIMRPEIADILIEAYRD